jgi:nucleoside-diphosphate-sugar epimerase
MSSTKVLVTGAQGCIGSWIVKRLLESGISTVVYDLDPEPRKLALLVEPETLSKLVIETGRIEDTDRVRALVSDHQITHIIHLAAQLIPFCQANPVLGAMSNVIGTLSLFEAARNAKSPIKIVYASSAAVWGPEEEYGARSLSEAESLKPDTHYGVFKQANEQNARVFYKLDGISSVGIRPWTVYGVGRDKGLTADPTIAMKAVALGVPFQIRLDGFMDLQHVDDVADAFVRCLFENKEGAFVFNLAGDIVSVDDIISALDKVRPGAAKLITKSGKQIPVAYQMDASAVRAYAPGIQKTPLLEGITNTIERFEALQRQGRLTPDLV